MRATALAALILALAGCAGTYFRLINAGDPPDGVARDTVVYDAGHDLSLDTWRPSGATRAATRGAARAPIVVFLHGGSWQNGTREEYGFVGRALSARGMIAVLPDYRGWPSTQFPGFVEDAARAVAWTRAHAHELGGDPRRIFLAGHSSGAHIAALLATDARYLRAQGLAPRDIAGVIGMAGPYDFLPITDDTIKQIFGAEDTWPRSQPVNFVDGDEPPFLLIYGENDRIVDPRNSKHLAEKLHAAGVPVRLIRYVDVGHVRIVSALRLQKLAPTLDDLAKFVAATPAAKRAASL